MPTTRLRPRPPAPAAAADPWEGRIRKLDDHAFEVDRALVRDLVMRGDKPLALDLRLR